MRRSFRMKGLKKVLAVAIAAVVLVAGVPSAAQAATTSSPAKTDISKATVKVATTLKYTGKTQTPSFTVKVGNTTLVEGKDYKVTTTGKTVDSGTYKATIKGIGAYTGTLKNQSYTIKATNKITVSASKTKVKKSALKKKNSTIKLTVKKDKNFKGKVTYKVTRGSKKNISVSKKGVVTLKKGAAKGTYKVKVSVAKYGKLKATSQTIKIIVA
jgi:hypothetical protein